MADPPNHDSRDVLRLTWLKALNSYYDQTKVNLKNDVQCLFPDCNLDDPESILKTLIDSIESAKSRVDRNRKPVLETMVDVFLVFNDVAAELASSLGVPGGKAILVAIGIFLKASRNISAPVKELEKLGSDFTAFACRSEIRNKLKSYRMQDESIFVGIFKELLNVLGLATKIVNASKTKQIARTITRKLNGELVDSRDRLQQLMMQELQITAIQILDANERIHTEVKEIRYGVDHGNNTVRGYHQDEMSKMDTILVCIQNKVSREVWTPMPHPRLTDSESDFTDTDMLLFYTEFGRAIDHFMNACRILLCRSHEFQKFAQFLYMVILMYTYCANMEQTFKLLSLLNAFLVSLSFQRRKVITIEKIILYDLLGGHCFILINRCSSLSDLIIYVAEELYTDLYHRDRQDRLYILRRQFAVEDLKGSPLNSTEWKTVWQPGNEIHLALILQKTFYSALTCPWCKKSQETSSESYYTCPRCKRNFSVSSVTEPWMEQSYLGSVEQTSPSTVSQEQRPPGPVKSTSTTLNPRISKAVSTRADFTPERNTRAEISMRQKTLRKESIPPMGNEEDLKLYNRLRLNVSWSRHIHAMDETYFRIHVWLATPIPYENQISALERRTLGTGAWLIEDERYLRWKMQEDVRSLWLYGSPGAGKTVLVSTAIADIEYHQEMDNSVFLAYFYFDSQHVRKQRCREMVASLVEQLSLKHRICYAKLKNFFRLSQERGQSQPSLEDLIEFLQDILGSLAAGSIYIIIDALDECTEREGLLSLLQTIEQWNLPNVSLFLAGRKEKELANVLSSMSISVDLDTSIEHRLDLGGLCRKQ